MRKYKIGYTQGVYDMFHVGHLNLLNNAKAQCEYLIVGINSDQLVQRYKHKIPVINEKSRKKIVENIKAVDRGVIVSTLDKEKLQEEYHFDVIFIGDDWKGNERWNNTERVLNKRGIDVVYLPYTNGISSTELRHLLTGNVHAD